MTNPSSSQPPNRSRRPASSAAPERLGPPTYPTAAAPGGPPVRQPAPPGRSPSRRLFWIGFFTSFLLLSVASCGGLVLSTGLNRLDLASLQGGEPGWTPPLVTPTPTPDPILASDNSGQADAGAFSIGQQVRNITSSRVNIRQTPGHLGKSDSDILVQMQPGDTVAIIGGPTSADNLVWWSIRYTASDGRTIEGWAAEATGSGVQILGQ